MPKMINKKQVKRGDWEFLFSGNTMDCKWMDNWSVLLLSSALEEGMNEILSVQREKGLKPILQFLVLRLSSCTIATWV